MKHILIFILCLISINLQSQNWLDTACNSISDHVSSEEFKLTSERNILKIIINQAGEIEINDQVKPNIGEIAFKELVFEFVTNPNNKKTLAEKPEKVVIQLKSFQKTKQQINRYKKYVQEVYLYLWDTAADEKYKSSFIDLNCKKREKISASLPLRIIENIEKTKKSSKPVRKGIGVPDFGGDTIDN